MMRSFRIGISVGVVLTSLVFTPRPAHAHSMAAEGRWKIVATSSGVPARLELIWPDGSTWKRPIHVSDLGLQNADVIPGTGRAISFRIDQDAGRFEFAGAFERGTGTGTFRFDPKRPFVAALRSSGVVNASDISDRDLMNLAFGGMSESSLHEFATLGFNRLSKSEMMDLAIQQVTPEFVRSLREVGVRGTQKVDDVVELRMLGVSADFVRALENVGIRGLSGSELVDLRMKGVTTEAARYFAGQGNRNLTPDELVNLMRSKRKQAPTT